MTQNSVSIVIVSRHRAAALKLCLTAVARLSYPRYEVIVVADPAGLRQIEDLPYGDRIKAVPFDEANISAARNRGIAQAAGDIVAFLDDDAVPETRWLDHLAGVFADPGVAAAGGYVLGRNGISTQWSGRVVDNTGDARIVALSRQKPTVLTPPPGRAVKTEGTNMAFRRSVLVDLGGFDPAFHYFLDETDLNMRLARAGHATAVVPLAEVHHGFAANAQRGANRVPRDLFEIGASWAVFIRKHVPEAERKRYWKSLRAGERQRLLEHMVAGGLDAGGVAHLMRRLGQGYRDGMARPFETVKLAKHPATPFKPFPARKRRATVIASRPWRFKRDLADARARVARGEIVTLISLSLTSLFHRIYFDDGGVWVQRGGLFGRSERNEPIIRVTTRGRRVAKETSRVTAQRGISKDA